jgi:hypothetical protein
MALYQTLPPIVKELARETSHTQSYQDLFQFI